MSQELPDFPVTIRLDDEDATIRFGQDIAAMLERGDLITVAGDLGAGKSVLVRAAIRSLAGEWDLEVPSPTFAIRIDYDLNRLPIAHCDLYRLSTASEVDELGLEEVLNEGALFVEWPERLGGLEVTNGLEILLKINGNEREAVIRPRGSWIHRLSRTREIRAFLDQTPFVGGRRMPIAGDASGRAYERVVGAVSGQTAIVMNAPRKDYQGEDQQRAYDLIVHRNDDPAMFAAIANGLRDHGIRAPAIQSANFERCLLLLEDFGSEGLLDGDGQPIAGRYKEAMKLLGRFHDLDVPTMITMPNGEERPLSPYDIDALLMEVSLFFDWAISPQGTDQLGSGLRSEFLDLWTRTLERIEPVRTCWTMRDFHSPNLFWLANEGQSGPAGEATIGVIDFQDMVIGHPAYDCVSIGQDARVTIQPALEGSLLDTYVESRSDRDFEEDAFRRTYAILGAQRASKIIGIFQRFAKRDDNPAYLRHMERVSTYLMQNLCHPDLLELKSFYARYFQ